MNYLHRKGVPSHMFARKQLLWRDVCDRVNYIGIEGLEIKIKEQLDNTT